MIGMKERIFSPLPRDVSLKELVRAEKETGIQLDS